MNLALADRFLPFVWDGTKRHSIREGQRWARGMNAHIQARSRRPKAWLEDVYPRIQTAGQFMLFEVPVLRVERICIALKLSDLLVVIGGNVLSEDERSKFLWTDGFRDPASTPAEQAFLFWRRRLPFMGQLIHWDYERRDRVAALESQPYMRALVERTGCSQQ